MNNNRLTYRLNAFSILEVTIVIALMALLSALFFGALNRFGEQVKNETAIKAELNNWFVVRSTIWHDLDLADSIAVTEKDKALVYLPDQLIEYTIDDAQLVRVRGEERTPLGIEMETIKQEEKGGQAYICFAVNWKEETMSLSYPLRSTLADKINTYFLTEQWQR